MAGAGRSFYKNVVPFMAMVAMECANVGLNTLFKAGTVRGMSYWVYLVYSDFVGVLLLLPAPFLSHRSRALPPLNWSIIKKIGLLGLIGSAAEILGCIGIGLSSPSLASAISNLVPALTFVFAVFFRLEKAVLSSRSSRAKISGTLVSISGALVVTLYLGAPVFITDGSPSSSMNSFIQQALPNRIIRSTNVSDSWVLGGFILLADYTLQSFWYIVQAQIMKEFPNELTVIFFFNLCTGSIAAVIGLMIVRDSSAWRPKPDVALASILCSGVFGSFVNNVVHTWTLRLKGPVYVTMFKPLSMIIAVSMGVMFLGDTLHIGSIIGATIIAVGFYTVMWGKAKEEAGHDEDSDSVADHSSLQNEYPPLIPSQRAPPLLQTYIADKV